EADRPAQRRVARRVRSRHADEGGQRDAPRDRQRMRQRGIRRLGPVRKSILKMGPFIERSAAGFTPEQYTEAAAAYGEAMMLLYRNDRGDRWYAKGMELVQKELKQLPADASPYRRFLLLNAHALLLDAKSARTGDPADVKAYRAVYDQAIAEAERDPHPGGKYAEAYFSRYCACEG